MSVMGLDGQGALWAHAHGPIAADKPMHKRKKNRVIAWGVIM